MRTFVRFECGGNFEKWRFWRVLIDQNRQNRHENGLFRAKSGLKRPFLIDFGGKMLLWRKKGPVKGGFAVAVRA